MRSQVEVTEIVKEFSSNIEGKGIELIKNILRKIHKEIKKIELESKKERGIRFKRTATQILDDGWVVKGKACTDLAIVFIAVAKAKGLQAKFVKIYSTKRKMLHSAVEIKIDGKKKYLDPTNGKFDNVNKGTVFWEYKIYKKGQDSWDIGLNSFNKGIKIIKELYG